MKRTIRFCTLFFLVFLVCGGAAAFSMRATRLSSPIHLHDGFVMFIQQDGNVTVLDAKDGSVVRQEAVRSLGSVLRFASFGEWIVGVGAQDYVQSRLFLFNPQTFELRWLQPAGGRYLAVHGGKAVHAGRDTVGVYDLAGQKTLWTRRVKVSQIEIAGNRLFLFCGGWEGSDDDEVVCVDLTTGGDLWRRTPAPLSGWEKMAVTETGVVLLAGLPGKDREALSYRLDSFSLEGDPLPERVVEPETGGKVDWSRSRYSLPLDGVEHSLSWIAYVYESPWRLLAPAECRRLGLSEWPIHRGELLSGGGLLAVSAAAYGERVAYGNMGSGAMGGMGESEPPDRRFHFLDGPVAWTGTPGYLNLHASNFVDRAASGDGILIVATGHGQVECLERETGRSRWIYLYPSRRKELTDPYAFKPALFAIGGYLHHLRRYWRETKGTTVTGTAVAGDPVPSRFRVVVSPQNSAEYLSYPGALLLSLGILFFVPVWVLGRTLRAIPALFSRSGFPGLPPARPGVRSFLIVVALALDFFLHLAITPFFSLFLETFAFCQVVPLLSAGSGDSAPAGSPSRWPVIVLFLPFLFWTFFAIVAIG